MTLSASVRAPRSLLRASCLALGLLLGAGAVSAQTYNATRQFGAARLKNPNGVWQYGYLPSAAGDYVFTPFPTRLQNDTATGWYDAGHVQLGTPGFWKNLGTSTQNGVPAGAISLHPGWPEGSGAMDNAAVLRFTAPYNGIYTIHASFGAGDQGETEAWVIRSVNAAEPLMHASSTSSKPAWKKRLLLEMGETLDFVVGHGSDGYLFDNTPLSVVVKLAQPF